MDKNLETESLRHQVGSFMHRYAAIDKIAARAQAKIDLALAPRFSVFAYIAPDELMLSKIIGDLLNPRGHHGQGPAFLEIFTALINRVLPDNLLATGFLSETKLDWEVATSHNDNTRRRIDILLENPAWVLAIENKPWAMEQDKQLEDYQKHIRGKYPDRSRYMLYLSGDNSQPQTADEQERAPVLMGYQRNGNSASDEIFLSDFLGQAIAACQIDKISHFLRDFAGWIANNFNALNFEED